MANILGIVVVESCVGYNSIIHWRGLGDSYSNEYGDGNDNCTGNNNCYDNGSSFNNQLVAVGLVAVATAGMMVVVIETSMISNWQKWW